MPLPSGLHVSDEKYAVVQTVVSLTVMCGLSPCSIYIFLSLRTESGGGQGELPPYTPGQPWTQQEDMHLTPAITLATTLISQQEEGRFGVCGAGVYGAYDCGARDCGAGDCGASVRLSSGSQGPHSARPAPLVCAQAMFPSQACQRPMSLPPGRP